ncbi:MAG: helix-turn-helix domain-containing protein [Dehalococcoidia bacterium]
MTDQNNGHHSYFTQVPHLVDDMKLTPAGFRLYAHLRRVCGEDEGGSCWQSQDRLAHICHMNKNTVCRAKQELKKKRLIRIKKEVNGGHVRHIISVVDIWDKNQAVYCDLKQVPQVISVPQVKIVPQLKTGTAIGLKQVRQSTQNRYRNRLKTDPLRRTIEEKPPKNNQRRKTNSRRVLQAKHKRPVKVKKNGS